MIQMSVVVGATTVAMIHIGRVTVRVEVAQIHMTPAIAEVVGRIGSVVHAESVVLPIIQRKNMTKRREIFDLSFDRLIAEDLCVCACVYMYCLRALMSYFRLHVCWSTASCPRQADGRLHSFAHRDRDK